MERFEIHIKMQMIYPDANIFENTIKAITRMKIKHEDESSYSVADLQKKLQDKIYSMIEDEEDLQGANFVFGEVKVHHKEKVRLYTIASQEFASMYTQSQRETYH